MNVSTEIPIFQIMHFDVARVDNCNMQFPKLLLFVTFKVQNSLAGCPKDS